MRHVYTGAMVSYFDGHLQDFNSLKEAFVMKGLEHGDRQTTVAVSVGRVGDANSRLV